MNGVRNIDEGVLQGGEGAGKRKEGSWRTERFSSQESESRARNRNEGTLQRWVQEQWGEGRRIERVWEDDVLGYLVSLEAGDALGNPLKGSSGYE